MQVIKSHKKFKLVLNRLRQRAKKIGFVPTMGALHEGHLSLVRRARRENDVVVVSIFVNPTQFGPKEDFKRYPRNLRHDQKLLKSSRVDFLFAPSRTAVYPKGFRNLIEPGSRARYLCGPKRPGHFRGVATVVHRLFEMVKPDRAYFGQKDYQQARVIEEIVRQYKLPVRIKTCPIIREKDGLAMSSRNRYLTKKERTLAPSLYQSLLLAKKLIQRGEGNPKKIKEVIRKNLRGRVTKIDYVEVVDPKTCAPVRLIRGRVLVALACFIGSTRLIDNLLIKS
jgi:pantoate--beta-alanine ligase